MTLRSVSLITGILLSTPAMAGKCDAQVRAASTAKGPDAVAAFRRTLSCDKTEAEAAFDAFMRAAGEVDAVSEIALLAIDAEAYTPVWNMMEKIPDYDARDQVARKVGASCATHAKVIPFLQGAYFGLRNIQFGQWEDAFLTCEAPELQTWAEGVVGMPPASVYDEKYNTIATSFALARRVEALPTLTQAAIAASAQGGPFNAIIEKMDQAVQPRELGASMSAESRAALEGALVQVANAVAPEQAALVADRLYNAGAGTAAASLLPRVYPDRVQGDGTMLYGAATAEICGGKAVLHVVNVREPAKRWSVVTDVEAPLRALKPRLNCFSDGPWPVMVTPEPVRSGKEVSAWAATLLPPLQEKGLEASTKAEKDLVLP